MPVTTSEFVEGLEHEWSSPEGFLFKFRFAEFDENGYNRLVSLLREINFGDEMLISRDVVSFSWNIPLFLYAHREINIEKNPESASKINTAISNVYAEIERIYYFRDNFGND